MVSSALAALGCLPLLPYHRDIRVLPDPVKQLFDEAAHGKDEISKVDLASFFGSTLGLSINETQAQALILQLRYGAHLRDVFLQRKAAHAHHEVGLDVTGFINLLLDPSLNSVLKPKEEPWQDMTAPLAHYYVYTSHNSYLTGNQLTSVSHTRPISTALLEGCRVIELDCWDRNGHIKVLHGGTLTKSVAFEDCLRVIKENAFVASPYPVIITIENHLPPPLQVKAAKILKEVFGDQLFLPNLMEKVLEFASPESLKGRIIISDKPPQELVAEQVEEDPDHAAHVIEDIPAVDGSRSPDLLPPKKQKPAKPLGKKIAQNVASAVDTISPPEKDTSSAVMSTTSEFAELLYIPCEKPSEMKEKQMKGGPLVCGATATMANLSEPQLRKYIKHHPDSIIEYTKTNLGRMYPFGLRFDSSNADPTWAWSHGFQLVALNLQGQDRPAWLARGFFMANGGCGYVKKPHILLPESSLDCQQINSLPPKVLLKVKILFGTHWHKYFDLFKKPDFYVKVAVHGIISDTCKKQTAVAFRNREPHWDEEFEFPIRVPEIAILRLEVWEWDRLNPDDFVGQTCIPVTLLRTGIRAVDLRSRKGEIKSSKLLCQVKLENMEVSTEEQNSAC